MLQTGSRLFEFLIIPTQILYLLALRVAAIRLKAQIVQGLHMYDGHNTAKEVLTTIQRCAFTRQRANTHYDRECLLISFLSTQLQHSHPQFILAVPKSDLKISAQVRSDRETNLAFRGRSSGNDPAVQSRTASFLAYATAAPPAVGQGSIAKRNRHKCYTQKATKL